MIEAGVERRLYDSASLSVKTASFVNSDHTYLLGVISIVLVLTGCVVVDQRGNTNRKKPPGKLEAKK